MVGLDGVDSYIYPFENLLIFSNLDLVLLFLLPGMLPWMLLVFWVLDCFQFHFGGIILLNKQVNVNK